MGETIGSSPEEMNAGSEPTRQNVESLTDNNENILPTSEIQNEAGAEKETGQDEKLKIEEEKKKIIEEVLEELKKTLGELNPQDVQSILITGHKSNGENLALGSYGVVSLNEAQGLLGRFRGDNLTTDSLKNFPGVLRDLDGWLTQEAKKRIREQESDEPENEAGREEKTVNQDNETGVAEVTSGALKNAAQTPSETNPEDMNYRRY